VQQERWPPAHVLSDQARQTNLLFIMSDQHQREASGCYGSREVKTPHIDAIASKAVGFDRTYCQAPVRPSTPSAPP